jgi:zinc transporter, ZIP family
LARSKPGVFHLAMLGLLGGGPTIIGCWLGGFSYSDLWTVFFLAIGAGAIFQVVWTIARNMMQTAGGSLFQLGNATGFLVGMFLMYGTALLISV